MRVLFLSSITLSLIILFGFHQLTPSFAQQNDASDTVFSSNDNPVPISSNDSEVSDIIISPNDNPVPLSGNNSCEPNSNLYCPTPTPLISPTPTPTPILVTVPINPYTPQPTPVPPNEVTPTTKPEYSPSVKILSNGRFEIDDFGTNNYWSNTSLALNRWYLVNDPFHPAGPRITSWVTFSEEGLDRHGHGLKISDQANCSFYCDTSAVQIVPAQAGYNYKLVALGYSAEGNSQSLYLDFLNSAKQRLQVVTTGGMGYHTWSPLYIQATAPTGTAYIRVILYSSNSVTGIGYWDDVQLLERGSF